MHLDEERLQRLLHRELSALPETAAREHVTACDDCRRRLEDAAREEAYVLSLLREVDTPPPALRAADVVSRAGLESGAPRARGSAWLRRAAALVAAVGIVGVAYALPGSPMRRWVHDLVGKVGGRAGAPEGPSTRGGGAANVSGIAVSPGRNLTIVFAMDAAQGAGNSGEIRVSLTGAADVQVRARGGAATFTTKGDFILIGVRDPSAVFDVRIPRSAPWVEILQGDNPVFLKEGTRITASGARNLAGGYVLPLAPSPAPPGRPGP
jgi:hypothetical protein